MSLIQLKSLFLDTNDFKKAVFSPGVAFWYFSSASAAMSFFCCGALHLADDVYFK